MLWGIEQDKLLDDADGNYIPGYTLADCFDRYAEEVSPKKQGERWEVVRLRKLSRDNRLNAIQAHDLQRRDIELWIDGRLLEVAPGTVNRELNLIISVVKRSVEWKLIPIYPLTGIERPGKTPSRKRRISEAEITSICTELGIDPGNIRCYQKKHQLGVIFLFAIETACRLGEICTLTWANVHLKKRFVHLPKTKNGDARDVPLSTRAVQLLSALHNADNGKAVFSISSGTASTMFTRYVKKAGIKNLHFHDTRHEAVTRLAKKLDMLQLAKVVGHRDPRFLMIYYEPTAEELAEHLD